MPRPPGPLNERDSYPVGVRIPKALYERIFAACGGTAELFTQNFPAWARRAFSAAVGAPRGGNLGDAQLSGFEEGRRQGWAHANRVFREALERAAKELKK
jgi:hypothetical protein